MTDTNSFIESLNMENNEKRSFNFGFVNLSIDDSLILMNIDQKEFDEKFKKYYDLGKSFMKFEILKKYYEISNLNNENLKEYGFYRNAFNEEDNKKLKIDEKNIFNTAELIEKLKEAKNND